MAGGLAALLDDIAAIARAAAASVDDVAAMAGKASTKAVGVIVDDAAVTPRYVEGFTPDRELPVIWKIARGSILNKAIIIVAILVLSWLAPWVLTPLLMVGGLYLVYEGAEKVWEIISGHSKTKDAPVRMKGGDHEKKMVSGAIRTDFILSGEIMVISNNELAKDVSIWMRGATLVVVALAITALVYGVVALIVKMDDVGLKLATNEKTRGLGEGLVKAMPIVLKVLSSVGIAAMLWVGGHILLVGMHELGFHPIYNFVHGLEEQVGGGFIGWLINTFFSAILGLIIGAVVVLIMHFLPFGKKHGADAHHDGKPTQADTVEAIKQGVAKKHLPSTPSA
ncbi:MAG TPA: DUF808 domain-containing protein [Tessaracoccus flavescens]|uniref:DUF808 domain-containing protein n=1 Tax=Tessaracoccus flavescens TaxID=399497 RepID=A0A921EMN1_9ACTN|nr:DUF808 domain-containing protein [Tessaracoccus flavescens]